MVSLRSGKKVPFLGKNIPKRAYTYKKPISKEEESDLITKIGSISIHEPSVPAETTVQDNKSNNDTYDSDETIAESTLQNDDQSTLETSNQSQIEIDTSEMPDKFTGIVSRFEAEMAKGDKHFKLMGLLNASTKLMNSCNPALLDSSNSSEDSDSSESSEDMTEDSILTSDASSINEENEKQNTFSDISSASSLSSTLKTMIDKAIESESSTDEDDDNDIEEPNAADERRPNFSENSYQEIYEMYNVIQM